MYALVLTEVRPYRLNVLDMKLFNASSVNQSMLVSSVQLIPLYLVVQLDGTGRLWCYLRLLVRIRDVLQLIVVRTAFSNDCNYQGFTLNQF